MASARTARSSAAGSPTEIQPRLLYHRHFMLTEHMNDAPEDLARLWYESYAKHIGRKYGATRVSLTQQTHYLPTMETRPRRRTAR